MNLQFVYLNLKRSFNDKLYTLKSLQNTGYNQVKINFEKPMVVILRNLNNICGHCPLDLNSQTVSFTSYFEFVANCAI